MKLSTQIAIILISSTSFAGFQMPDSQDPAVQFNYFYSKGQMKTVQGRAQGLSAFNLDLQMYIHYKESLTENGAKTFKLASNGNRIINETPVFPISGKVVYEVLDKSGELEYFKLDGEQVTFTRKPFTMYLIESDTGYQERLDRLNVLISKEKDPRYEAAKGRMVAIVRFDLQKQDIEFFQIDGKNNLIQSGVFNGSVAVPKVSYF